MKIGSIGWRKAGFVFTIVVCFVLVLALWDFGVLNQANNNDDDYEETWVLVAEIHSDALGEYDPGTEGWLSAWHLDYGQTPETVLQNNATDWSADANARGYVDTDGSQTDLKSEDPSYVCFRAKFDDDAKDGGAWDYERFRINLTISGDETISDRGESDNSTNDGSNSGDAVVSAVGTNWIYINFWWDDNNDGYRITDDGSLVWSISIYEKK
jgi:hypothetical protein